MRQRMTDKMADAAKKAWKGVAVLACCEAVLGLLAGRVATLVFRANPINPMSGLATASPALVTDIALNPFDVAMGEPFVRGAVGAVVLGTLALALVYLSRGMKLKNEDTENAHGKDRLATEREAGMFVDHAHPYNNLMVSEHAGIVLNPHDVKTRDQQAEKNLNCVTLGISGLGKTYNLVYPDMMRACGTALPAIPCAKRGKPDKEVALPLPEGKTDAQMGFDVFATDTKGDTLRDCGEMLEKAGFDLRVFNTISLLDGQSYNPFASRYVKTHLVDKYDPEQMSVGGRVDWRDIAIHEEHSEGFAQDADLYRPKTILARSGKGFIAQIDMKLETEMTSIDGVDMSGSESLEDIDAKLKGAQGEAAEELRARRDRKLMEGAMGAFGDRHAGRALSAHDRQGRGACAQLRARERRGARVLGALARPRPGRLLGHGRQRRRRAQGGRRLHRRLGDRGGRAWAGEPSPPGARRLHRADARRRRRGAHQDRRHDVREPRGNRRARGRRRRLLGILQAAVLHGDSGLPLREVRGGEPHDTRDDAPARSGGAAARRRPPQHAARNTDGGVGDGPARRVGGRPLGRARRRAHEAQGADRHGAAPCAAEASRCTATTPSRRARRTPSEASSSAASRR